MVIFFTILGVTGNAYLSFSPRATPGYCEAVENGHVVFMGAFFNYLQRTIWYVMKMKRKAMKNSVIMEFGDNS